MSNQIVISSGAKVRELEGVITGTTGILNSVPLGAANGVATLDAYGKVPLSQLPASVVTYLGTWNAATNTPTLANGTGDIGDLYICNVAGTVNFGSGPITFAVGDWVIYNGTSWQKSAGQNGTVTSVAASITGNSVGITGSPITTAGTLAFAFAGTNLQYVNGAGNLTTFPTLITSIGLSMPSAFNVANSPLTANGTIAVTGAGTASQYIRGDGALATFPATGGGGSAVYYYLNGSVNASVTGYKQMANTAVVGTGTDLSLVGNGLIAEFLTDTGNPNRLLIPAGAWNIEMYFSMSSSGGNQKFYVELLKYNGTTFTLIASNSTTPEEITGGTTTDLYLTSLGVPETTLLVTDRLALRIYIVDNSIGRTTTLHTEDNHLCQVTTTFSSGIAALNGLTANTQYFATGTSGSDFNISSVLDTHTFNIPSASATARGLITTGTQTIAGSKTFTGLNTFTNGNTIVRELTLNGYSGTSSGALHLYQNTSPSFYGNEGYTDIWANGKNVTFNVRDIGTLGVVGVLDFSLLTDATTKTYNFPNASGTLALTSQLTGGTVTSVAALTLGTTGTDLSSTVANSTTTPVITLNVPTASATNRGALSSTDWSTFNGKQAAITLTTTGSSGAATLVGATLNIPNYGTALSGYLPLTGGTLTGNLNGTTASFTGNIQMGSGTSTNNSYTLYKTTGNYLYVGIDDSTGGTFGNGSYAASFYSTNGANMVFYTNSAPRLIITGSGVANFSNLVYTTNSFKTDSSVAFKNITSGGTAPSTITGYSSLYFDYNKYSIKKSDGQVNDFVFPNSGISNTWTFNVEGYLAVQNSVTLTTGSVLFGNSIGKIAQNNSKFFWDDTNFRLGIGTSSPSQPFHVYATATTTSSYFETNSVNSYIGLKSTSGICYIGNVSYAMTFEAGGSERMRITSVGDLLIGTTGLTVGAKLQLKGSAFSSAMSIDIGTNGYPAITFQNSSGAQQGYIVTNSASVLYVSISDYRLKQDLKDYNGLDLLNRIKTYDYKWKLDNTRSYGVMAHELQEIIPQSVFGEKDGKEMQGVDYSKIVPILIKSIQEQQIQIEELKKLIK